MTARNRLTNQAKARCRSLLGCHNGLPDAERTALAAKAAALAEAIEAGDPVPEGTEHVADFARPFVIAAAAGRAPFEAHLKNLERRMRFLATTLPVYPWAESIRGFGELGLAIIVGEAGDLSVYSNPGKLWKRLGVAPPDCYAMETKAGSTVRAIPRARRSRSWVITDSLLRADNPYRDLYRERRKYEVANRPEFDKGVDKKTGKPKVSKHCDLRARRYAEKRLLKDLWRAWRRANNLPVPDAHPNDPGPLVPFVPFAPAA